MVNSANPFMSQKDFLQGLLIGAKRNKQINDGMSSNRSGLGDSNSKRWVQFSKKQSADESA